MNSAVVKDIERDTELLNSVLSLDKTEIPKSQLINVLLDCIETVAVNETQIYIKLKKDLILHGQNTAMISNGLNIQLAKLIHLNPDVSKVKSQINTLKIRNSVD